MPSYLALNENQEAFLHVKLGSLRFATSVLSCSRASAADSDSCDSLCMVRLADRAECHHTP